MENTGISYRVTFKGSESQLIVDYVPGLDFLACIYETGPVIDPEGSDTKGTRFNLVRGSVSKGALSRGPSRVSEPS